MSREGLTLGKDFPPSQDAKGEEEALANYMWSWKCPTKPCDLKRRAQQLEQQLREKRVQFSSNTPALLNVADKMLSILWKTTYNWEALKYTDKLAGEFAAVSRVFHKIQEWVPDFAPHSLHLICVLALGQAPSAGQKPV